MEKSAVGTILWRTQQHTIEKTVISDEKNVIKLNKSVGTIWRTQQHTIEKTVISDEKNVIK